MFDSISSSKTTQARAHGADPSADVIAKKSYLMHQFSIFSLFLAFVVAASSMMIFGQDQISEHKVIAGQENELNLIHLKNQLDEQLNEFVATADRLSTKELQTNPNSASLLAKIESASGQKWIKLKIYNQAGSTIFSSSKDEIGRTRFYFDEVEKALLGDLTQKIDLRESLVTKVDEVNGTYVALTSIPLTREGSRIGAIELYKDSSSLFERIQSNSLKVATVIFGSFTILYAALYCSFLKTNQINANREKVFAKLDAKIHDMAFYDALTHLPNRHLLKDRLEQAMTAGKRTGLYCALLFLDLDNFKPLNDAHGHGVGDLLLVEVAHRLISCVRAVDTVARFGGDEFVLVLTELDVDKYKSALEAKKVAEKIHSILDEPYALRIKQPCGTSTTVKYECSSSIGFVLFINHESGTEDLIMQADSAMYQAKTAGCNVAQYADATS